jgi:SAM-dependent methyltransferase
VISTGFCFSENKFNLRDALVCPECLAPLPSTGVTSVCPNGHSGYTWRDSRAVFETPSEVAASEDNILNQGILARISKNRTLLKIVKMLLPPNDQYKTKESRNRIWKLSERFRNAKAINVGSGSTNYGSQFINVDIDGYPNVHVVTTVDRLPFPDGYFDLVVCQAVLEHVPNPDLAVKEMIRILKPEGELYAEIPFLQGFHPTPNDYQRYTISGIEHLFSPLIKIEKGVINGPASALSWILREFLAILFSFNSQTLYKIGSVVFAWIIMPLKFCDILLARSKFAHHIASGFFFHGQKFKD